jgi:hypothetical protein
MAVEVRPATHNHFFASALVKVFILEVTPWAPSSPMRLDYTKLITKIRVFFQIESGQREH